MNKPRSHHDRIKIDSMYDKCQILCLQSMGEGFIKESSVSMWKRFRLAIRKFLGPRRIRKIKRWLDNLIDSYDNLKRKNESTQTSNKGLITSSIDNLEKGDLVRVKSKEDIEATLNHWRQLRGCTFMPEMAQYCGSEQRVLKPVRRFVDERDLRVLEAKSIVILEGLNCQGTISLGQCDRNCFYFWRIEWLEKIDSTSSKD